MRVIVAIFVLALAGVWSVAEISLAGDLSNRRGDGESRVHRQRTNAGIVPRQELERIARYYGPQGTIPGVTHPNTVRVDFSRATRFNLEKHARRYGPALR